VHIGMIHFSGRSFPTDIRIEKEAKALISSGHKITVLTIKTKERGLSHEEIGNNFFVRRVSLKKTNIFKNIMSRFTLIRSEYVGPIVEFISSEKPDVLHVHDFTLLPTVLHAIHINQIDIQIVADLHENMPALIAAVRSGLPFIKRVRNFIFTNDHIWRWHEARLLPECSRIIVVVPESIPRLESYGVSKNKIIVVSNTEDETTFNPSLYKPDADIIKRYKDYWVISYIGGLGPHRGVDTVLKSIPLVRNTIPNFKFLIVGVEKTHKEKLHKLIKSLDVAESVEAIDWQPFDKVLSYVTASTVCLVPYNDYEHTQTTVPHKLFQYMISRKPLLVSNCRPLQRIIEDTEAGVVFEANDHKVLSERIIYMHKNPEKLLRMAENGFNAATGKYAWRHDARRLVNMYKELELNL